MILKVAVTEMYPRIPWELVADPWGFAKHTLGTMALDNYDLSGIYQPPQKSAVAEKHSYQLFVTITNGRNLFARNLPRSSSIQQ